VRECGSAGVRECGSTRSARRPYPLGLTRLSPTIAANPSPQPSTRTASPPTQAGITPLQQRLTRIKRDTGKYTVPRLRVSAPSSMAGRKRNRIASALMTTKLAGPTEATHGSSINAMAMSHQWATPIWMTLRVTDGARTPRRMSIVATPIKLNTNTYEATIPRMSLRAVDMGVSIATRRRGRLRSFASVDRDAHGGGRPAVDSRLPAASLSASLRGRGHAMRNWSRRVVVTM
jgi:hypothetical protein